MARLPRFYIPGYPQHVIQRGNNRAACFYEKGDYQLYLTYLKEAAAKYQVAVHAYVLMTNHVHLLVTPQDKDGISRMMQSIGRKYVQFFNHKYSRTGTLWEGRYKSTLVDTDNYLFTVYRYIEMNPVRAGIVKQPIAYPWSSFKGNALGKDIPLLTPHELYTQLGKTNNARQAAYRQLFNIYIAEQDLTVIREATNKGWVLGDDEFKTRLSIKTGRRCSSMGRGGDRKSTEYQRQLQ